jgi:hypothetical protein
VGKIKLEGLMGSKLRFKYGNIEIEHECDSDFPNEKLLTFLKDALDIVSKNNPQANFDSIQDDTINQSSSTRNFEITTNAIAAKLDCTTGADLIIAAAAHLTLVEKLQTFSRQQILKEMKSASGYYKKSYSNNLSQSLDSLIRNEKLLENSENIFSLKSSVRVELERQLAD